MKSFYAVLINSTFATITNTVVWFAITFWVYLQTQSVIATSMMAGIFTIVTAASGFFMGSLVDRYPKKHVMLWSSLLTLALYALALAVYLNTPTSVFSRVDSPELWLFILLALVGAMAGNLRSIALATLVTLMVSEDRRDKANGVVGTANGVSFLIASTLSGLAIGFVGVTGMMVGALALTLVAIVHLLSLQIPDVSHHSEHGTAGGTGMVDIRGTIRAIALVPGLFGLIFFHTFNNFLGGVFMSLMDAYGLQLVSVQVWGTVFGVLSLGFIVGGTMVARRGLGANPLRTLFLANIVMWSICVFFTLRASIVLMAGGMFVWFCLVPVIEAAEQTILQKVVAPERQGRVFGFAQSVEQAASPITAFLIGPIAELFFIPFMTNGTGVELLGPWIGIGPNRGLALLFTLAGVIGLVVTLVSMRSRAYRVLSLGYSGDAAPSLAS